MVLGCIERINVPLALVYCSFYVSCFFLALEDVDDVVQGWHFQAQVASMDCCVELIHESSPKDCVIRIVEIYYIKCDIFCPCIFFLTEGY